MRWRVRSVLTALMVAAALPHAALAQLVSPQPFVIPAEPDEVLAVSCDYTKQFGMGHCSVSTLEPCASDVACPAGETCVTPTTVSSFTYQVTEIASGKATDPHPEAIVAEQLVASGLRAPLLLAPKGYCSTTTSQLCQTSATCPVGETCKSRHGKRYQIHVLSSLTNGMAVACNYRLDVSTVVLR